MLHIVFVEAALETVPPSILRHPSVRRSAKRQGKRPEEVLLNRSLHHSAMSRLPEDHKRGRPDIAQICLLEALGAPLNREGGLRVWLHTFGGYAIEISPEVRVPRDCNRFNGLMEQLFSLGRVPPEGDSLSQADEAVSIHAEPIEAWVVTSRLIYEYEKTTRS
jgi:rRNA small subunit pseudouridine methyltransferase Nep1